MVGEAERPSWGGSPKCTGRLPDRQSTCEAVAARPRAKPGGLCVSPVTANVLLSSNLYPCTLKHSSCDVLNYVQVFRRFPLEVTLLHLVPLMVKQEIKACLGMPPIHTPAGEGLTYDMGGDAMP